MLHAAVCAAETEVMIMINSKRFPASLAVKTKPKLVIQQLVLTK